FEGGVKVGFVVVERPFVRDVDFVGNKHVSTNELQDKIDLKLGSVYNPVDVQRARERMKEHYESEGYFEVQITPDIEKFADGDVKVVFTINEGRQMKIDKIVIRGNRASRTTRSRRRWPRRSASTGSCVAPCSGSAWTRTSTEYYSSTTTTVTSRRASSPTT